MIALAPWQFLLECVLGCEAWACEPDVEPQQPCFAAPGQRPLATRQYDPQHGPGHLYLYLSSIAALTHRPPPCTQSDGAWAHPTTLCCSAVGQPLRCRHFWGFTSHLNPPPKRS